MHIDHPVHEIVNQNNGRQDTYNYVDCMSRDTISDSSEESNLNLNAETESEEQHMVNINDSLGRDGNESEDLVDADSERLGEPVRSGSEPVQIYGEYYLNRSSGLQSWSEYVVWALLMTNGSSRVTVEQYDSIRTLLKCISANTCGTVHAR